MKKRYILTFLIPIVLAAIIAFVMTPSAKDNFIKNLTKFNNLSYVYYDVKINTPDGEQKIQQYKVGGIYFAKYYIADEPLLVFDNKGKLEFGVNSLAVSSSAEKSKAIKSVFWLDKLSVEEIDKNSITRINDTEVDKFSARLNNGTEIEVTFNKGTLTKIVYKNIPYLLQLFPLNANNTQAVGDVEIDISNFSYEGEVNLSYKFADDKITVPYKEFTQALEDDYLDYEGAEEGFAQIKRVLTLGGDDFSDDMVEAENEEEVMNEEEPIPQEEQISQEENAEPDLHRDISINEEEFQDQGEQTEKEVPPDFELME